MAEEKNRSFFKTDTYENFRNFLKVNFYYCSLSQEQQAEYNIKPVKSTRYNEYLHIVQTISDGKIDFPKYNRKKAFKYDVTQFESDYNVLADSFQFKTATALEICLNISILCLLSEKPMSFSEISEKIAVGIEEKTVRGRVISLCEYGLISCRDRNYFIEENLFYAVDENLLLKLLNMTDFMKNLIYPEALGYSLFGIVKRIYEKRTGKEYFSLFQFKYRHLANILDDNILWILIEAIEKRQHISFVYDDKTRKEDDKPREKIIPVKIFTENEYARRYLFAVKKFNDNYKFFIFRLSKIYNLKIMKKENIVPEDEFEKFLEVYENEKEYSFFGKLDSSNKKHTVELQYKGRKAKKQLKRDFKCIKFGKNNMAEVTVKNKKMIIPYLRANMETVRTTDEELSEKLKSEIEELKKIYGIV